MRRLFAIALGLAAACGPTRDAPRDARQMAATTARHNGALAQMHYSFAGHPAQSTIKARLDRAFVIYGLAPTEENYSRAGGALLALRQEFGVDEMALLEHMIAKRWQGLSFPHAAARSCRALRTDWAESHRTPE